MAFLGRALGSFCMCYLYLVCKIHGLSCPSGIFAFGDSLSDTGNYGTLYPSELQFDYQKFTHSTDLLHTNSANISSTIRSKKFLPYRAGDGRLIIDFVAQAFGFPFLNANYRRGQDFSHGVNYAVSSSTARDTAIVVPYYLSVQVENFIQWNSNGWIAPGLVPNGLFFVFIGLNDFWQNAMNFKYSAQQLKSTIAPDAAKSISRAIYNLHANGARTMMIVGIPAIGCLPSFLTNFGTNFESDYDSLGCLSAYNDAAGAFNSMLYNAVQNAQADMPDSTLLFANLFQLHRNVVASPSSYGLSTSGTTNACCQNGNCCSNPYSYITWDGLHFTEGFNRLVATSFLKGNFNTACRLELSKF